MLWKIGAKVKFVPEIPGGVAAFDRATNTLKFLEGKSVTLLQGFHEYGHALHLDKIGLKAYEELTKGEREQWVLDWMEGLPLWNHLNATEKAAARAQPGRYR